MKTVDMQFGEAATNEFYKALNAAANDSKVLGDFLESMSAETRTAYLEALKEADAE